MGQRVWIDGDDGEPGRWVEDVTDDLTIDPEDVRARAEADDGDFIPVTAAAADDIVIELRDGVPHVGTERRGLTQ